MDRGSGTKEKRVCISQRAFRDRHILRFIREPHYLNCFSTPKWELLYVIVVELSTQSRLPASIRTGTDSSPTCRSVSLRQLRGRIGKNGSPDTKACLRAHGCTSSVICLPWGSSELQGVYSALFPKKS